MKIVCDNCATKYSIADEKVRGKVFKIRCKKCSHIIVVRGGDGAAAAHEPAGHAKAEESFPGDDPATVAQSRPPVAAAGLGTGEAVWHLVIDREQIGPLTAEEVRAKFAAREIDAETYGWREGFADWLRVGSIDDFRDLGETQVPGPSIHEGATRRTDTADLFATAGAPSGGEEAPAPDLFAGSNSPSAPTGEAQMPPNDLFAGGGSQALFSAPQASAPAARGGRTASPGFGIQASAPAAEPAGPPAADAGKLTGQRSESSVLFSLNNLQALASGGGGGGGSSAPKQESRPGFASSQSEGSGLIDIRAMAASTLASGPASPTSSKNDEPPSFAAAPLFSPMAAPILMPSAAQGPPKWIWALLGIGVLAVLGIIGLGVVLLTKKPEIAPVALNTAPAAVAVNPGAPNPAAANPAAPAAANPAAANPAAAPAAETKTDEDKVKKPKSAGSKSSKPKESGSAPAAAPAAAAPAAAPAAKPKAGKRDELDDLLNTAAPDKPSAKHAAPKEEAPAAGGKEQLDRGDIVGGMGKIKGRVTNCYDQFKVPGMASVTLTIGRNGRVSSASVSGSFAGTPTGSCVESAVKSASFPPFTGSPQTINYPFMLR